MGRRDGESTISPRSPSSPPDRIRNRSRWSGARFQSPREGSFAAFFLPLLMVLLILGSYPLVTRARFDRANDKVLLAVDLGEVDELARGLGRDPLEELELFHKAGVNACITTTHTLTDLVDLGEVKVSLRLAGDRTTLLAPVNPSDPFHVAATFTSLLGARPEGGGRLSVPGSGSLINGLKVFRDHRFEERAAELGMTSIHRIHNAPWIGPEYLKVVTQDLPKSSWIVFDEKQALGYPSNLDLAAKFLTSAGASVAMVEFAGQVGVKEIISLGQRPSALLHSISPAEMAKLPLSRILPRWARAATERNTRILVAHLFPFSNIPYPGMNLDEANRKYIRELVATLKNAGFTTGSPMTRFDLDWLMTSRVLMWLSKTSMAAALCLILAWIVALLGVLPHQTACLATFCVLPLFLLGFACAPSSTARLLALGIGALTPAVATMAAYRMILDSAVRETWKERVFDILRVVFFVLIVSLTGGLLVLATLSESRFVFRLEEFTGVKVVYLLGPAVAFAYYFWHHRLMPFGYPIRVRDALIVAAVGTAGLVYILRSGNYLSLGTTGSVEYSVRDSIEAFAAVRPRTKEFLVGIPALVLLYFATAWGESLWTPIFLLASAVASVSAVNSFCHIHTPPALSIMRGILSVPLGLVLGALFVPLYRMFLHTPARPLVTISGYLGFGNLGDELILTNLLSFLRERLGRTVTLAPYQRAGTSPPTAMPDVTVLDRSSPFQIVRGLRQSAVHVSLGGGLFQDRTGKLSSLYYLLYLCLARLFCVPGVLVLAHSFSSIQSRSLRRLVALFLSQTDMVMARDSGSARRLISWGYPAFPGAPKPFVGVDLACWNPPLPSPVRGDGKVLGLNLRPLPGSSDETIHEALSIIADLARANDWTVDLLSLQTDQDRALYSRMEPLLHGLRSRIVEVTVENHREVFAGLDRLIATRYHAILLGFLAEMPLFALSYDDKTEDLLDADGNLLPYPYRHHLASGSGSSLKERLLCWVEQRDLSRRASQEKGRALVARAREAKNLVARTLDRVCPDPNR